MKEVLKKFEVNDNLIELFKKYGETLEIKSGEYLFKEGDEADSIYLLLDGELEVFVKDKNDSLRPINKIEAITFFGEMGLFASHKRTASIRVAKNAKIIKTDYNIFLKIASKFPSISLSLLNELSVRLKQCNEELVEALDVKHKFLVLLYVYKLSLQNKKEYIIDFDKGTFSIPKNEFLKMLLFYEKMKVVYSTDLIDVNKVKFSINRKAVEKHLFQLV